MYIKVSEQGILVPAFIIYYKRNLFQQFIKKKDNKYKYNDTLFGSVRYFQNKTK